MIAGGISLSVSKEHSDKVEETDDRVVFDKVQQTWGSDLIEIELAIDDDLAVAMFCFTSVFCMPSAAYCRVLNVQAGRSYQFVNGSRRH